MDASNPRRLESVTPAEFHILVALGDGERHGYGIMQEVARSTEGGIRLAPGTLYRSIKRLLEARLIADSEERPAPEEDDERRRYYRLTDRGRAAAEAEARHLQRLVQVAQQKQLLPRPAVTQERRP